MREDYLRKLAIKLDGKYSISNMILRVGKSEMHLKTIVNVYIYEENKKVLVNTSYVQEHQWIQVMKNPYQEEMMKMFDENKGWLNGYGVALGNKTIETEYIEIEILFTVSGIVAERR